MDKDVLVGWIIGLGASLLVSLVAIGLLIRRRILLGRDIGDWDRAYTAEKHRSASLEADNSKLTRRILGLEEKHKQLLDQKRDLEGQILEQGEQLKERAQILPVDYRIVTFGMAGTGKTALTLKWAHPTFDLGTLEGTQFQRYQRIVSLVANSQANTITQYNLLLHDWGGEFTDRARDEMGEGEIHGMLLVVDLAKQERDCPPPTEVDDQRIEEQISEFNPTTLKYIFSPKVTTQCKTVVLFINKADLISGTPPDVEATARQHYEPLINALEKLHADRKIDLTVVAGSALYGHNTHVLYEHFIRKILPPDAYDPRLVVLSA